MENYSQLLSLLLGYFYFSCPVLLSEPAFLVRSYFLFNNSICIFLSYILKQAGFKVGLYTSPHLIDLRERIRILTKEQNDNDEFCGKIPKKRLVQLLEYLKPKISWERLLANWVDTKARDNYTWMKKNLRIKNRVC